MLNEKRFDVNAPRPESNDGSGAGNCTLWSLDTDSKTLGAVSEFQVG